MTDGRRGITPLVIRLTDKWALVDRITEALGGRERRRTVLLLAAVLSLSSADGGTIGALAGPLEKAFHVGDTKIGLLFASSSLVAAVATLPMGIVADRANRVRVLSVSVLLWGAAMVASGVAVNFTMLLLTRVGLGIVTAAAGPVVASLTGDLFDPGERSRMYGYMLAGEVVGAGAGLLVAGDLGAAAGWRYAFFLLAVPSVALGLALLRLMPEPPRGVRSWLHPAERDRQPPEQAADGAGFELRKRAHSRHDVEVDQRLVLHTDATQMGPWRAAWYVLRIPSNRILIASSALGYFFFAGLRAFAVLFSEEHYRVGPGLVSGLVIVIGAGALVGTVTGGRLSDRMIERGRIDARLIVSGVGFVAVAVVFLPGILTTLVVVAVPLFAIGAAFLGMTNPALDAARLDIVASPLWGRAEAVRTFMRTLSEAFAPLLFGYVSAAISGGASIGLANGVNTDHGHISAMQGRGLEYTFVVMLVPLAAAGVILLRARRSYLGDMATADASEQAQRKVHSGR